MIATTRLGRARTPCRRVAARCASAACQTDSTRHASAPPPTGGPAWIGAAPARGDLAGHPVSDPAPLRMPDNLIAAEQAPAHRVGDRAGCIPRRRSGYPDTVAARTIRRLLVVRRLGYVHGWIGGTHDRIGSET